MEKGQKNACFGNSCHQCFTKVEKIDAFYIHILDVCKKVAKCFIFQIDFTSALKKAVEIREAYFKANDFSIMMYVCMYVCVCVCVCVFVCVYVCVCVQV